MTVENGALTGWDSNENDGENYCGKIDDDENANDVGFWIGLDVMQTADGI